MCDRITFSLKDFLKWVIFYYLFVLILVYIYTSNLSIIIQISFLIWYQSTKLNNKKKPNPSNLCPPYTNNLACVVSMAEESSSTNVIVSPRRPTVLNRTYTSQNLILINVNAQALLKLTTTNYSTWQLQFTSLLFEYDLLGLVESSKSCPPALITLPDAASPSPNLNPIL